MRTYASIRQTLVLDADDTLWQNNLHFDRAVEEFIDYLNHSSMSRDEVRAVIDETERANIAVRGYGAASFAANLGECYERLVEGEIDAARLSTITELGKRILKAEIELLHGVEEALDVLSRRHDLVLFTKGQPEEQQLKIDRSGLGSRFRHISIVPEKDVPAYLTLVTEVGSAPGRTWMVGNSPRSDINPALAAGLNAVFIPHDSTWRLEHEELASGPGTLLVLDRFPALLDYF